MATKQSVNDDIQLVSKQRVADYGEVYTSQREVNAMLDLVKQETDRIESRFLEPACGTGNFLIEVLTRKLAKVASRYSKSRAMEHRIEYERYSISAISSLYGIDILQDNVLECRGRLFNYYSNQYIDLFGLFSDDDLPNTLKFILERNIVWGDALTLQTVGDNPKPIVFSEWSLIQGGMVKRRDFSFFELLYQSENNSMPLFSDTGDDVFIPEPEKEYPLTHYLKLYEAGSSDI
ncbi:type III restriction endonuclease subunit M [Spirochaetia bacterium]|nr:type III restriction endonuclease subunit M [Spirochaetia bacterium]